MIDPEEMAARARRFRERMGLSVAEDSPVALRVPAAPVHPSDGLTAAERRALRALRFRLRMGLDARGPRPR